MQVELAFTSGDDRKKLYKAKKEIWYNVFQVT